MVYLCLSLGVKIENGTFYQLKKYNQTFLMIFFFRSKKEN